MDNLKKLYQRTSGWVRVLSAKKYTSVAGMLVFFMLLSLVPFSVLLTLLFGKILDGTEEFLSLEIFKEVRDLLMLLQENAKQVSSGATFFLGITTLYSASNFFYHLRRSGEIIYEKQRRKGLVLRAYALLATLLTMFCIAIYLGLFLGMVYLSNRFLEKWIAQGVGYLLLFLFSFFVCWALNLYICPIKVKWREMSFGSVITAVLWLFAVTGFSIYLRFGGIKKLYGAMTALVVFFLWVYVMMVCFVIGAVYNEERCMGKKRKLNKAL